MSVVPLGLRSRLRAVIFDFNGVLVDDEPLHFAALRQALAGEGIELSEYEYKLLYLGLDDRKSIRAALEDNQRRATPEQIDRLLALKSGYYRQAIEKDLRFFPGAVELLRKAVSRCRVAIASGALRSEIDFILRAGGLEGLVPAIVSAEDVREAKPNPEAFLTALQRLNELDPPARPPIRPEEILVIEDSLAGVDAAIVANMTCLAVASSYPAHALMNAHRVAASLEEVDWPDLENLIGERKIVIDLPMHPGGS